MVVAQEWKRFMRLVLAMAVSLMGAGCAHLPRALTHEPAVSNEARLDEATAESKEAVSVDVDALRCRDTSPEVRLARDASGKTADRVARYDAVIKQAKDTQAQFDEEFRKNPDLIYGATAEEYQRKRQVCTELISAFERERLVLQADAQSGGVPDIVPAKSSPASVATVEDDVKPSKHSKAKKEKKDKVAKVKSRSKKMRIARADGWPP
jgi:hypothetical protein